MLKTKLLVGALAFGVSVAANATFTVPGNSEFAFSAWDSNAGVGYTYDLEDGGFNTLLGSDVRMGSFIGALTHTTTSMNSTLGTGVTGVLFDFALPSFGAFLSRVAVADVQWNLVSIDNTGLNRVIQTVSAAPGATSPYTNAAVRSAVSATNIYFGAVNSAENGTMASADDGYAITTLADGTRYAGNAPTFGSNFGNTGVANAGGLDQALDLYVFGQVSQSTTTANNARASFFGALADVTGNGAVSRVYVGDAGEYRLQIAVVPEPETYAMLLAGLGLIGFAARRRRL